MKLFDHILLKFYSLIIILITVAFVALSLGFFYDEAFSLLSLFTESLEVRMVLLVTFILLLLISLRFLFLGSARGDVSQTINTRNDLGEVRTSIHTFEAIASRAIQKVPGVRESQVRLRISEVEGHQFFIKIVIDGEIPIPSLTDQVQREVKAKVEEITGVGIQQVSVLISEVISSQPQKPRRVE